MINAEVLVTAGSAAVVAFLVLAVYLMGFRGGLWVDEERMARELAVADPDARIAAALIGADGRAGLARLGDGRLLGVRAMGDGVSVRLFRAAGARMALTPGRLKVVFGDPGYPALHLRLQGEPPPWLKDIAA